MSIYIMTHDAEGGGTNCVIVSAASKEDAFGYMAGLGVENIGCALWEPTVAELEDFLHDYYDAMATLSSI